MFVRETSAFLASKEKLSIKDYLYFPYCPKCAKKYGHHYIVVVSQAAPVG